jgi:hypothetical protein
MATKIQIRLYTTANNNIIKKKFITTLNKNVQADGLLKNINNLQASTIHCTYNNNCKLNVSKYNQHFKF